MKKQFLNLGKSLNRVEQKNISGGYVPEGTCKAYCWDENENVTKILTCTGSNCSAEDNDGCYSDTEQKCC